MFTVAIEHVGPIEVKALAESLGALGSSFARFVQRQGLPLPEEEVRLYVREIRSGSILIDLVALASQAPVVAEHAAAVSRSVLEFAGNVNGIVDYFRGRRAAPPEKVDRRDVEDVGKVLEPIAAQHGSHVTFTAAEGAIQVVNFQVGSNDAAAVLHRAEHWAAMQALPANGIREKVLFYWYQAQDKAAKAAGDRGVIESISKAHVKTIFASEEAKAEMLDEALFRFAYVVDVDVQTIGDKPRLYKILQVHDRIEREE